MECSIGGGEASASSTFSITVNPVNDAPILATISNQSIDEDNSFSLDLLKPIEYTFVFCAGINII